MDDDLYEDDIPYDIDLIAEEFQFYNIGNENEPDQPETGRDSGYGTARWESNEPPPTSNSIRAEHDVTNKKYWDNVLKKELICMYEERQGFYDLNPNSLVYHILKFIRSPFHQQSTLEEERLFMVQNDKVVMNRSFSFPTTEILRCLQSETLEAIVSSFLPLVQQLEEIINFVDRQEAIENAPVFIQCLCSVIRSFFVDYDNSINELSEKNIALQSLPVETKVLRERTQLIHCIVTPIKSGHKWKWIEVEYAWFILINSTGSFAHSSVPVIAYAVKVQQQFIKTLFRFFDFVFSSLIIPSGFTEHSILFNEITEPNQIFVRKAGDLSLTLWSLPLITEMVRALKFRKMLNVKSHCEPFFTNAATEEMAALSNYKEHNLFNVDEFRQILLVASKRISDTWSSELFAVTKEKQLHFLYKDMRILLIGKFADILAQYLYKPGTKEISFSQVLRSSGLSRTSYWDFNLKTKTFTATIPPPLDSLFRKSLVDAMSGFLELWLKLFRMKELLESIKYDTFRGITRAVPTKRRFRYIVDKLSRIVGVMREQFYLTLNHLTNLTLSRIDSAENFTDVELVCRETESLIISWTSPKSSSCVKDILSIIQIYEQLIDDIRLKSLGGHVEDSHISDWNKKTTRSIEYLVTVGKNSPPNSIFYFVYLQLGYRPLFVKSYESHNRVE